MKAVKGLFKRLSGLFTSPSGKRTIGVIVRNVPKAMPYIQWAAFLSPTSLDDAALTWLRGKYPRFFNGEPLTDEEMKLLRFLFASERLLSEDGELNDSTARAAVSNAFALRKAELNG